MRDWSSVLGLPLWVWLFVMPGLIAVLCLFAPRRMQLVLSPVWRVLDRLYLASGVAAALFMITILMIIVAQMVMRWSGIAFPGSTNYAGYAMAATSFFALAHALMRGAHIRVSIFLNMNRFLGRWLDVFAISVAAVIATYFARFAVKTMLLSKMINERTQGQDRMPESIASAFEMLITRPSDWSALWAGTEDKWVYTPVWIPQISMAIGSIILAIALWDTLTRTLATGRNPIVAEAVE